MALEPITRQEKIIAGQDLTPITRMEKFLKDFGGGGSIPKPLTYDYMPEGYPSKSGWAVTLMEEQEVAFSENFGLMVAKSPVDLDIKPGDKLTVVWDGVSYDVTVKALDTGSPEAIAFGNLGLTGTGAQEDYPFCCAIMDSMAQWATSDTATSHTIKVMRQQETITPMSTDFIPKNFNVVFIAETGVIPTSCNATYDELRGWVENNIPILSIYRRIDINYAEIIANIHLNSGSLALKTATNNGFIYNSDGTFSVLQPS